MITVRQAVVADAPRLVPLGLQFLKSHEGYSPLDTLDGSREAHEEENAWRTMIQDKHVTVFAAVHGADIVGALVLRRAERLAMYKFKEQADIDVLVVDEKHRRSGVGKLLYHAAEEFCKKHGIPVLHLTVRAQNSAADFWTKLGFKPYDTRYYRQLQ